MLYSKTMGLTSRSAGLSPLARTQVTEELLEWADEVYVMEKRLERLLRRRFPDLTAGKRLLNLRIPDDYQYLEPALTAVLIERLTPLLGPPDAEDSC